MIPRSQPARGLYIVLGIITLLLVALSIAARIWFGIGEEGWKSKGMIMLSVWFLTAPFLAATIIWSLVNVFRGLPNSRSARVLYIVMAAVTIVMVIRSLTLSVQLYLSRGTRIEGDPSPGSILITCGATALLVVAMVVWSSRNAINNRRQPRSLA